MLMLTLTLILTLILGLRLLLANPGPAAGRPGHWPPGK